MICLIRLAVSRAGDKKKIDLSGEESGNTASQEPQEKPVKQDSESQIKVDSGTSLRDESGVPTSSSQLPQPRVTAVSQNNNAPPPPPPMPTPEQLSQVSGAAQKNSANTTAEKSPVDTTQENALPAKKFTPPKNSNPAFALDDILKVKKDLKRPQSNNSTGGQ